MLEVDSACDVRGVFYFIYVVNITEIVPFLSRLHNFRMLVSQVRFSNTLIVHLGTFV